MYEVWVACADECENYAPPRKMFETADAARAIQEHIIFQARLHTSDIRKTDGLAIKEVTAFKEISLEEFAQRIGCPVETVRAVWQSVGVVPKEE